MKLNILYSSNDAYVSVAGVSIVSLLENNREIEAIEIHFIDCGLKEKSIHILQELVFQYQRVICFHTLEDIIACYKLNVPNPSYYGRLFATNMTCDDKILYLDSDLLIVDSLIDLWKTDITGYSIAAVQGPGISLENRDKLNFPDTRRYINSGMMLINMNYWREHNLSQKMTDFLNKYGEIPPYHDQNIINAICHSSTLILHPKYNLLWSMMCCKPREICKLNQIRNYYSDEEITSAIKYPVIIHFSNSIYGRPWKKGCHHKYKDLYLYYKQLSPWKDKSLDENNMPVFRKIRNCIYCILPSRLYYLLQVFERWMIQMVLPNLPFKKLNQWIKTYMNGK